MCKKIRLNLAGELKCIEEAEESNSASAKNNTSVKITKLSEDSSSSITASDISQIVRDLQQKVETKTQQRKVLEDHLKLAEDSAVENQGGHDKLQTLKKSGDFDKLQAFAQRQDCSKQAKQLADLLDG